MSLSPNAEKLVFTAYPNELYVYDFQSESYSSLFENIEGHQVGNAVWENDNIFFIQNNHQKYLIQ